MLVRQRIQINVRVMVLLAVALALLAGIVAPKVSAQEAAVNTLKVSPVRSDIEIAPGASKTVKVTVTNLTDESIMVRTITNDFVAGDESGTPALILDEDKFAPTRSLKRFMAPLHDISIDAGDSKTVDVVINVPEGAEAGGYFGAVRFAPTTADSGGQVNMSASVASLILLTVPGDAPEKLVLSSFTIQQDGVAGSTFRTSDNLEAVVRFQNEGALQVGPFGKFSVKKGSDVIYEADFNNKDPRDMILPDSARRWTIPIDNVDGFGYYTVIATFTYGKNNQTIEVVKSFWVIPTGIMIAALVALLVIVALGVGLWLFLRNRKRRGGRSRRYRTSGRR